MIAACNSGAPWCAREGMCGAVFVRRDSALLKSVVLTRLEVAGRDVFVLHYAEVLRVRPLASCMTSTVFVEFI